MFKKLLSVPPPEPSLNKFIKRQTEEELAELHQAQDCLKKIDETLARILRQHEAEGTQHDAHVIAFDRRSDDHGHS